MYEASTIAKYYLAKDKNHKLFNDNIVTNNNRNFYEGNARLNKYLFLTQVVYLARYEKKLIKNNFIAYENGPIVKSIMNDYSNLTKETENIILPNNISKFLDKIYDALKNASVEELIEITHEDPEWLKLKENTYNGPTMNLEQNIKEYQKRYKGLIEALDL